MSSASLASELVNEGLPDDDSVPYPLKNDGLGRFVTVLRWITTAIGLAWAALTPPDRLQLTAALALVVYSAYRTWRPLDARRIGWRQPAALLIELAFASAAVVMTGTWTSTFIFALFVPVVAAGFARGQNYALFIAAVAAAVQEIFSVALANPAGTREVITWTGELLLVAVVASYGRTLLTRAEEVTALGELQSQKLAQANALLSDLDHLARDLYVSFDFQDAIRSAFQRIGEEVRYDTCILLLWVQGTDKWDVALAEGVRLPGGLESSQLPQAALTVVRESEPLSQHLSGNGFDPDSAHGLYVSLTVSGRFIGLIALEKTSERFADNDRAVIAKLAREVALSVDNARWFERLQSRGAARERTRMARDLHDRLGQSIAYVAFELDRLTEQSQNASVSVELSALRDNARATVRELRETLSDLRTDVTESVSLPEVIGEFLTRVELRSGTETELVVNAASRIDLGREQEVWRVAQEAISNSERHGDASKITVRWIIEDGQARLEVEDDGIGIDSSDQNSAGSPGQASYGITGMRERASLLGAALEISSPVTGGTKVQLRLSAHEAWSTPKQQEPVKKGDHDPRAHPRPAR